jgi:WXG100 family type VII secretion target
MAGEGVVYNFGGIDSVQASIEAFVGQMRGTLGEVDAEFRGLISDGWKGASSDAFHACSVKWGQNADAMAETLRTLGRRVGEAGANMQQADNSAAAQF